MRIRGEKGDEKVVANFHSQARNPPWTGTFVLQSRKRARGMNGGGGPVICGL